MAIRERIILDTRQYKRALNETEQATDRYADQQKRNYRESGNAAERSSKRQQSSFKKIGQSAKYWLAGVAAGATAGLIALVKNIGGEVVRFNAELNKAFSIQGDLTQEQKDRMASAAKEVAAELNIATDKVAEGYFFLASAGLSVEQQIANLPQVASFAKAGMFDLATATDLATDAQSALGLTVKDTEENQKNLIRVTDVLTKANTIANATIEQFSESLTNKGATRLRQYNKSIEEGAAVLAAYADQGIKGQRAGERLNILLRELARASRENAAAFKEAGIAVFDANGEMRNVADIIADLETSFKGLTDQQIDSKLAQLGFSSEVSDSIAPLLGLSEKVRGYESDLRSAAGTTEEVANNQIKSITERFGLLKRQIIETFGDDVLNAIEATANALEGVLGLFKDTQKEAFIRSVLPSLEEAGNQGLYFDDYRQLERDVEAFYDKQKDATDEFNRQNRALKETIDSYSTWAEGVGDSSKKVADATEELKFRELVLKGNIERNKEAIDTDGISVEKKAKLNIELKNQRERLESVQKALKSVSDAQSKVNDEDTIITGGGQANPIAAARREYKKFLDLQREIDVTDILAGSGNTNNLVQQIQNIEQNLKQLGASDIIGTHLEEAVSIVDQYNQKLTILNNERDAGNISAEQYQQRVNQATDQYLKELQQIYNIIKGSLSPEQEKMFESLFGGFEDASDQTKEFKDNLDDIADTVDAIVNVGNAFGLIGENAKDSLRGISDVLRGVQKIKELSSAGNLTALSGALPAIGIAGGLLSVASGFFSGDDKVTEEMINEMKSLNRAIKRNTEAVLKQAQVGSRVSQSQLAEAERIIDEIENIDPFAAYKERGRIRDLLNQLGQLGLPGFENIDADTFNTLVDAFGGDFEAFAQALLDLQVGRGDTISLSDLIDQLTENLGQFGDSLEGAIEKFQITTKLGGDEEQAFDTFIQDIIGLVGQDNELTALLKQVSEAETEKERKDLAQKIFEAFQDNPALIGSDLTGSDLQEIIDIILGQSDATGSASSEYSRSTQIANSITEIQANEMIFFLERIEAWTRSLAANFGDETAIQVTQNGGSIPSFNIPIPLPVKLVDDITHIDRANTGMQERLTNKREWNFGDINIGGINRDVDDLSREIAGLIKQEMRGTRFR